MSVAAGTPTGSTDSIIDCSMDTEANCRDNELAYMYTYYLPGTYGDNCCTSDYIPGNVSNCFTADEDRVVGLANR
jgi:hypothetical protein